MSFGASADNLPAEKPKPLGVDATRLDTHEQGRVLPYVAGMFRIGGTFLGEPWNVRSEEIRQKVGKKKQTVGYNYYCSFAVAFCLGPIDRLDAIYLDDDEIWSGGVVRGVEDYLDITISSRGTLRLYWGTDTQVQDSDLAASGTTHPAYRGQCYAVFLDWSIGSRTNIPNIEIQGKRIPTFPWIVVDEAIGDDVNPVAVLADLWQSPFFGLGLSADRLNQPLLNATAATLEVEGLGLSPIINSSGSFRQALAVLLDHIDGYVSYDSQGRFGIGLVRGPAGGEPTLNEADLTDLPDIESVSWWETYNEVFVRFRNRDRKFADESVSWRDRGNFAVVGSTRSLSVSRPWVTKQKVAWLIAASLCRQKALPFLRGTIRVKRISSDSLDAGSLFYLSYANSNVVAVLCRVLQKTQAAPESADVLIGWQEDRGYLNANWADVAEDVVPGETSYETSPPHDQRVIELPYAYKQSVDPWMLFLVARGDSLSNGFNAYRETSPSSFEQIGSSGVFALRGTLQAEFDESVLREDDNAELDVLFDSPDKTLESVAYETALTSAPLRLFVGDEIMVGYTVILVAAGRYRIKVLRASYGTRRRSHVDGAEVFALVIGQNAPLEYQLPWNPGMTSATFKVQPYLMHNELDLGSCPEVTESIQRRAYCPLPPLNLRVNGDGYAPTYAAGEDITVDWDAVSGLRAITPASQDLLPDPDRTVIAVHDASVVYKGEVSEASSTGPLTISNADLVAILGAETDFILRGYSERGGFRSLDYDQISVKKA